MKFEYYVVEDKNFLSKDNAINYAKSILKPNEDIRKFKKIKTERESNKTIETYIEIKYENQKIIATKNFVKLVGKPLGRVCKKITKYIPETKEEGKPYMPERVEESVIEIVPYKCLYQYRDEKYLLESKYLATEMEEDEIESIYIEQAEIIFEEDE